MTKIIWMSDPHFQNEGTIRGLDPRIRLKAALEHANTHYPDADFGIISGDLVGDDIDGDYGAFAKALQDSGIRFFPMMGNNDERHGMRRHLALPDGAMGDFLQYTLDTPDGMIVCLDTHKIGSHAGELCDARRQWLKSALAANGDRAAFVFMHHPPLALGLPKQDEIMLEGADTFLMDLLAAGTVRHLFLGHVHRHCFGTVRGLPFASLGSIAFQAPPPRPAWDWNTFEMAREDPQYAVIDLNHGDVTVQTITFCAYETGQTA